MGLLDLIKGSVEPAEVTQPGNVEGVTETTTGTDTPIDAPTPEPVTANAPEPQVDLATAIAKATENKFNSVEELYNKYRELESKPQVEFPDEWSERLFERIKAGEDLTPYIRAKTMKLDDMGAEDLFRMKLKDEYPGLSDDELTKLYNEEVVKKYKLDPESFEEDEMSVGKIRMKKEADAIRREYQEKLKPYLQPEPLKAETPETEVKPEGPTEEEILAQFKEFEEKLRGSKATKELLDKKTFEIPTVDNEKFNLEVENPEELIEMAVHADKFFDLFNGEDGPDLTRFYQVASFARNPQKYIELLVQHGKELGKAEKLKEIENPSTEPRGPSGKDYENPWDKLLSQAER